VLRGDTQSQAVRAVATGDLGALRQDPTAALEVWGTPFLPQAVPAFSTVSSVPAFRLSVLRNARHLLDDINAIWDGDLPFRIAASAPSALPRQRSIYRSAVWRGTGHHDWPTPNGLTVMRVVRD